MSMNGLTPRGMVFMLEMVRRRMRSVARDTGLDSRGSNEACWATMKNGGWTRSVPVVQFGSWVQQTVSGRSDRKSAVN